MASIHLTEITFNMPAQRNQLVYLRIRKTSDPDIAASYTDVDKQAAVGKDGTLIIQIDITALLMSTSYTVWAVHKVSGSSYLKAFVTPTLYTSTRTGDFQKDNCTDPQVGSIVTFSKDYTSIVSQGAADAAAAADTTNFNTLGQAYANTHGVCNDPLPSDAVGIVVVDFLGDTAIDICMYVDTPGIVAAYHKPAYSATNNYVPGDGTVAANCWILASDHLTESGGLVRRFELNIARMVNTYGAVTSIRMPARGRSSSSGTINGSYSLKGADAGYMTMGVTGYGAKIPGVTGATTIDNPSFSGKPVVGGADGTCGIAVGAEIIVFLYDVPSKTLTIE